MDNAIKLIEAIGKQWPFLLVVFLIIVVIIKWHSIWNFIASLNQITLKKGDTALELNRNKEQVKNIEIIEESVNPEITKPIALPDKVSEPLDELKESYYIALKEREYDTAKTLFAKILENEDDENIRKELKLNNLFWRHHYGDTTAFLELETYVTKIEHDEEHKSVTYIYLGSLFSEVNNYQKAIEMNKMALDLSQIESTKAICVKNLSDAYYKNGEEKKSLDILFKYIKLITEKEPLQSLYLSIARFYEKKKDKFLESVAYQKALEFAPNNTTTIFSTAYSYSELGAGFYDLGLLLYKRLLLYNPNENGALNNIGVAYKNLDLNIKSVDSYKISFEKGNSLAASNLAYLLINSGFAKEAEEYLQKGQGFPEIHDNIFNALSLLKTKTHEEVEAEKKILAIAEKKYLFFNNFGNAVFDSKAIYVESSKNWIINESSVKITIDDKQIFVTWDIEEAKHSIVGNIVNNSLILTYKKPTRSLYSYSPDTKYTYSDYKGYGYISSPDCIICKFEIEKAINDFVFKVI